MADSITGILRVIHILTGVAWVGSAFLWGMVIAPRALAKAPPPQRRPFAEAVIPALTRFLQINAVLALVSGIVLVGMIWGWPTYFDAFQAPTYGPALAFGAFSAIAMAIVGFGIAAPTGKKLLATMASVTGPPTAEQQAALGALGKKLGMLGMATIVLGTLAVIGMAWAVNAVR